jgi:hypothetical protein
VHFPLVLTATAFALLIESNQEICGKFVKETGLLIVLF